MIVNDFNVPCVVTLPFKTNSPLVIYPNAVLSFAITVQRLQAICRRDAQIIQRDGRDSAFVIFEEQLAEYCEAIFSKRCDRKFSPFRHP